MNNPFIIIGIVVIGTGIFCVGMGLGVVDQKAIKDLRILNEARNLFAHSLDVDSQEFENKFLEKIKELSIYPSLSMNKPVYAFNVFSHSMMMLLHLLLLAKDEPITKNLNQKS